MPPNGQERTPPRQNSADPRSGSGLNGAAANGYADMAISKPVSDRDIEDRWLLGLIRDAYAASSGVYGARRVFGDLRETGESCGKHRVAKIMRRHGIKALRGYKAPRHISGRRSIISPNHLNRCSPCQRPTGLGSRTSRTCERGRAGCIWRSCWTCIRAKWSAGQ